MKELNTKTKVVARDSCNTVYCEAFLKSQKLGGFYFTNMDIIPEAKMKIWEYFFNAFAHSSGLNIHLLMKAGVNPDYAVRALSEWLWFEEWSCGSLSDFLLRKSLDGGWWR